MITSVSRFLRTFIAALIVTAVSSQLCLGATLFERSMQQFQLRAQKANPADYTFVVMGDSRDNDPVFRQILALAASVDPLFIVHGGDYSAGGGTAETEAFLKTLREAVPETPFFVVPGNHETRAIFTKLVGPSHFTVGSERLGLTFVAVDNADYLLRKGETEYLRAALSAAKGAPFVMMHVPPKTERWSWHTFSDGADELRKILVAGKVQAAFFSHVHLYDQDLLGGIPAYVTGGAGAPLLWLGFPGDAVFHVLVVHVQGGKATIRKLELPKRSE